MNTIQHQWETFAAAVLPPETGDVQRQEMRRAFYAGFYGAFCQFTGTISEQTEEAGVAMIQGLSDECTAFKRDVLAGKA